jgi:hypothetical protein
MSAALALSHKLKCGEEFTEVLVVSQLELETGDQHSAFALHSCLKGGEEFAELLVVRQLELETTRPVSQLKGGEEFAEVLVIRQLELETGDQPRSGLLLPVPAPQQPRLRTLPRLPVF